MDGAAIGSPLSPVIANVYIKAFEEEVLEKAVNHSDGLLTAFSRTSSSNASMLLLEIVVSP